MTVKKKECNIKILQNNRKNLLLTKLEPVNNIGLTELDNTLQYNLSQLAYYMWQDNLYFVNFKCQGTSVCFCSGQCRNLYLSSLCVQQTALWIKDSNINMKEATAYLTVTPQEL